MTYSNSIKIQAQTLRKKGFSMRDIAKRLKISISTASLWLRDVNLDDKAQKRLKDREILGQYKTAIIRREKTTKQLLLDNKFAKSVLKPVKYTKKHPITLLCPSLLGRGLKDRQSRGFYQLGL